MQYEWDTIRTTTDKLSETLNDLAWEVHQIQYTGGRDWVVIQRQEEARPNPTDELWDGTARRARGNKGWEIHIPDIGKTRAHAREDIDQRAKELVASKFGISADDVDVDIEVDERPRHEVTIEEGDLKVTPLHAPGQPVNHGPRAIQLTHNPTGLVVTAVDGKSQLENKALALEMLRLKIAEHRQNYLY